MARKSRLSIDPLPGMDLTPMIDIVFNLIIFFMIVSELSNLDVEQIELPFADRAEKVKPSGRVEDKILQVNVLDTGLIKVRQKPYTADPQQKQSARFGWLGDLLQAEAAGYEREPPEPGNPNVHPSKLRINIRSDKRAPFKHVQQVFDLCIKEGIYKTSLGATQDDPK